MKPYLNLSTRGKLMSAFAVVCLFTVATILFAYHSLSSMRQSQRKLLDVEMANVVELKDIRSNHHAIRAAVAQMMLAPPGSRLEALRDDVLARNRELQADLATIGERKGNIAQRRDQLREFEVLQTASIQTRESQILPLLQRGRTEEARELFTGIQLERDRRLGALADELIEHATRGAAESVARSESEAAAAVGGLITIAALTVLSGVALVWLLTSVLSGPLRALSDAAQRIASGDLTVDLPNDGRMDETGMLTRTFRQMVSRLREMMREVGEGVAVLASAASEITASTAQVAASSAQTASAVAQTSATAEEVKQTAKVASDKAMQVQEVAQKCVSASQSGLQAMDESISAMHQVRQQMDTMAQSMLRLADQGVAIGEIITTVDDLADQSNLLSVNAAIEAARAGEEGAGFRVVAQEIRSLAEQSKQATVQVRALLGDIQKATGSAVLTTEEAGKAVRAGVDRSEGAARWIRSIAEMVNESADAAAQIAASAQQQAVGMEQVAYAMQDISQASTQNVAATRQTDAAAHGLQDLGLRLKGVIEQYRK